MEMQQEIENFIKAELSRLKGNSELHDQCCYEDYCYGQVIALKKVLEIIKKTKMI